MPLMQHPALFDYIISQVKNPQDYKQSCFSIRTENNEIVALFHGTLSNKYTENSKEFSAHIMPGTFVENLDIIPSVSRSQYQRILEKKLFNNKNTVWYRDYCNFGKISLLGTLMNVKGTKITTNFTRIINLQIETRIIQRNFRKSYKSLINQAEKKLTLKTLNNKNITRDSIKKLYDFHQSIVGKKTRHWNSWEEQYKLVTENKAFFVEAYEEKRLLGFSYFLCFGEILFYFSSAFSNESFGSSHAIIWHAIKYAMATNCKLFDIGEQVYKNDTSDLNIQKLKTISHFKRGFGGYDHLYLDFES